MNSPITTSAQTTTQSTKQPARRFRTLAAAIALAIATIGLPAVQAHATDNAPADPGVGCAAQTGPGG